MERKKNTFALEKESSMAGGRENCVIQQGVVLRIEGERMVVGVAQAEACSACAARAAGGEVREVVVRVPKGGARVGDRVTLGITAWEGFRAMFIMYVVPFVIVLVSLIVLVGRGVGEGLSGVVSIGLVLPYYILLYVFRDRIEAKIRVKGVQKEE